MRAIRFVAGLVLAPALSLSPAFGQGAGAGERALPALDQDALRQCMADERQSRALLERHRRESEALAAAGRVLDEDRRGLARLRGATDPLDAGAVERYNGRAAEFDARVQRHNAGLASLEAGRQAQRAVAQRYNANCGGRHYQPHTLRTTPGR